jgi:hypothetical protein
MAPSLRAAKYSVFIFSVWGHAKKLKPSLRNSESENKAENIEEIFKTIRVFCISESRLLSKIEPLIMVFKSRIISRFNLTSLGRPGICLRKSRSGTLRFTAVFY